MKTDRHKKILELIDRYEIGTQEELAKILNDEGYNVTQETTMQTTIIYITGIYDTLDLFTQELKNAFETMGYASFTYDARLEEESKQALIECIEEGIKKGCLYCSVCGHEAQIVSDYNVLEDDYLRSLLKDGESAKNPQKTEVEPQKNKKKKNAVRNRILPERSLEEYMEQGGLSGACEDEKTPEQQMLNQAEIEEVQAVVAALPEKYRMPVYLNFSAGMTMQEIAVCLHIPLSTVKTRMRKAKALLKEQLEAIGYDG